MVRSTAKPRVANHASFETRPSTAPRREVSRSGPRRVLYVLCCSTMLRSAVADLCCSDAQVDLASERVEGGFDLFKSGFVIESEEPVD